MDNLPRIHKKVISLKYFLDNNIELWEKLKENFSCPRNLDVEKFLKEKSVRFENTHNSRTYLIFDENNISSGILAYFSLTFKEIYLPEDLSKTQVKDMDGISKNAKTVKGYLLGQIGKNSFLNNTINLESIFEEIYSIIIEVQILVGGRLIFLDCEDNEKLINLYTKSGFRVLKKDKLVQMYRAINLT